MRSDKRPGVWWSVIFRVLFGVVLVGLAGLLAGCPSKAPGHLRIQVSSISTDRCDDGIKVEVAFDDAGLTQGPQVTMPENDDIYGGGANWIWVKPGKLAWIGWTDDPYDHVLPGGPITITAWCMRTGGQAPGKSVRVFNLGNYVKNRGVVSTTFVIRDMSADPDTLAYSGYTEVTSPAPSIFDWEEWCDLGVPGDCMDID